MSFLPVPARHDQLAAVEGADAMMRPFKPLPEGAGNPPDWGGARVPGEADELAARIREHVDTRLRGASHPSTIAFGLIIARSSQPG